MFSQIRLAALAATAAVGLAATVAPADAWQCHGSYQNDQGYSNDYTEQGYSQGYSCQGQPCDPRYPSDQYSYGQDYNNGPNYQDNGPNDGS